jgi:hypothetical protein
MLRTARDLKQRLCAEPKEQVVNYPLILQSEWRQFMRQNEDNMDVACGQQFELPHLESTIVGVCLTFRAVPVSAGVV